MTWKEYREYFKLNKATEAHFVLGADIGASTSSLAFFNTLTKMPEVIDMSGGYGKPSMPTVIQYVPDGGDWVFGEYAVTNRTDGDLTFFDIAQKLGRGEFVEIEDNAVGVPYLAGLFIKELIGTCSGVNPKATIAGLVCSCPTYAGEETKKEFFESVRSAGYEQSLISFTAERECIFSKYFYENKIKNETALLIDFGARELRGGIYSIIPSDEFVTVRNLTSAFDQSVGTNAVDAAAEGYFTDFYLTNSGGRVTAQTKAQLASFTHQHKDLIFQKNGTSARVYYNFAYPPIRQQITQEHIKALIKPFSTRLKMFIEDLLLSADISGINTVICTGGGFEMPWAKTAVKESLPKSNVVFYKNSKSVAAEGASIIAAAELGIITVPKIIIDDTQQLTDDIGVKIKVRNTEDFVPLAERNSFWRVKKPPRRFLLSAPTGNSEIPFEIFRRDAKGRVSLIKTLKLNNLPTRPAGTTFLNVSLEFSTGKFFTITVEDLGFGEIFPATEYSEKFSVNL
jgi:molecular chaperone DnaK (HSP70)